MSAVVGALWMLSDGAVSRALSDGLNLSGQSREWLRVALGAALFALVPAVFVLSSRRRPAQPGAAAGPWDGHERRNSERLFFNVINNLPVSLTVKDRERRFLVVNEVFLDWVGLPEEAVLGRTNAEVFSADEQWIRVADAEETRALREGVASHRTQKRVLADGKEHTLLVEKFPIFDEDREIVGVGTSLTDITMLETAERAAVEREEFLKAFLENSPDAINVKDPGRRYVLVNRRYEELFGVTRDALIGKTPQEAGHISSVDGDGQETRFAQADEEDLEVIRRGVSSISRERTYRLADGTDRTFLVTKFPILGEAGQGAAVASILTDITARKQVENALLESEARLRAIFDHLPMNLNLKDRQGRFLMINAPGAAWLGKTQDEVIGGTIHDVLEKEMADRVVKTDRIVLDEGRVISEERPSLNRPGEGVYVNIIKFPVRRADGEITGVGTAVLDITERKQAEAALRDSEARFRAMFDHLPMSLTLKDREGHYLMMNAKSADWLGVSAEEMIGKTARDLYGDGRADLLAAEDDKVIETGEVVSIERQSLRRGDESRFVYSVKFPVRREDGVIIGVGTALQDITERKQTEADLSESESRFRAVLANVPTGISMRDEEGRYILVNRRFEELFEISADQVLGKRPEEIAELYSPETLADLNSQEKAAWETGAVSTRIREQPLKGGGSRLLQVSKFPFRGDDGRVIAMGTVFVDVTESQHQEEERVRLEKQLQQAQKLEAVGRLAGGIAHDFNNLLGAIMGFAEFLEQDLEKGSPQHNFAWRIWQAGQRAKQLVGQILTFSRTSSSGYEPFDLIAAVEECRLLLRGTLPTSTAIEFNRSLPTAIVDGSGNQISQVIMNLSVNANDALGDTPGKITIDVSPDGEIKAFLQGLPSRGAQGNQGLVIHRGDGDELILIDGSYDAFRDYAVITVADTGQGMDRETLERLFEPFFTTKEHGKGTGLGMSVVHGIVMGHRGAIIVKSRKGVGTAVSVLLPLLPADVRPADVDDNVESVRGVGYVLVVDDEADVADMLSIGLERHGFEVGVCTDGSEALDVFKEDPAAWDAVITDQSMPELKGNLLVQEIKRIRPEIPCIICTGFSEGLDDEAARAQGADAFYHKPVSPKILAGKLRDLMAG